MTASFETHPDTRDRRQLRRLLRARRQALAGRAREEADERLIRTLLQRTWFRRARHLGLYLASDGEPDPLPAVLDHRPRGQRLYLPVLDRRRPGRLLFTPWTPGEPLLENRYGIGEPVERPGRFRPLWALDALLIPLVGFDRQGNRLGMGGGFYDRTLAALARAPRRPRLAGIAYGFQKVSGGLPVEAWDQPVDEIVTDGRVFIRPPGVTG